MQTSWTLFSAFGIPVRANLSVGLLALYLLWVVGDVAVGLFLAAVLLVSIVLHEFAHSVVAMAFGGRVRDITLQLLGGCAAITRMPSKPWQECLMAAAGPASSFLFAGLAWWGALVLGSWVTTAHDVFGRPQQEWVPNFWLMLAAMMNLGLGCFNLVPAFPMDGGRVLRSLLQTVGQTKVRATEVAVIVGRGFAGLWVAVWVLDVLFNWRLPVPAGAPALLEYLWQIVFGGGSLLLLCIAYMIWVSGKRELDFVRAESYYGGWR